MESLNKVILVGVIGDTPTMRFTQSGTAVMNIRLITTEQRKDKEGNDFDISTWHNVVVWGKRAIKLNEFLAKGFRLAVEGRIENKSYENKNGEKRYRSEVSAQNVILLGSGSQGFREAEAGSIPPDKNESLDFSGYDVADDDVPF